MKADFTRNTFDAQNRFIRVLMQQGRVQVDADHNEQVSILLHYLQSLAKDLIGDHGGRGDSFKIEAEGKEFTIHDGHYYVDGILCENDTTTLYSQQQEYPVDGIELQGGQFYLVYLDVWERLVTLVENGDIHEIALGNADTAMRSKVVWQVKVVNSVPVGPTIKELVDNSEVDGIPTKTAKEVVNDNWNAWVGKWQPQNRGKLRAMAREMEASEENNQEQDHCIISPEARFRRPENQLYRVEIHREGNAWDGNEDTKSNAATFKWSRDNGSVIFPVVEITGSVVIVEHLGPDDERGLKPGHWVEVVYDKDVKLGQNGRLLKVIDIDPIDRKVQFEDDVPLPSFDENSPGYALLRRWDGGDAQTVTEGNIDDDWIELEDGVMIQFFEAEDGDPHQYRTGDYWLIPARAATGDVLWPPDEADKTQPAALSPHGVEHHFAPLSVIFVDANGNVDSTTIDDCRCSFGPKCP